MKHKASCRIKIPYRAKLDEAGPCEASDIRDARMGIRKRVGKLIGSFFKNEFGWRQPNKDIQKRRKVL